MLLFVNMVYVQKKLRAALANKAAVIVTFVFMERVKRSPNI